jgi:hypothetical protein
MTVVAAKNATDRRKICPKSGCPDMPQPPILRQQRYYLSESVATSLLALIVRNIREQPLAVCDSPRMELVDTPVK